MSALEALRDRPRLCGALALFAEIADRPDLLRAYADHVGPDDGATLLLHAGPGDASTVIPVLQQTIADAGLAEDGPDMLLLLLADRRGGRPARARRPQPRAPV